MGYFMILLVILILFAAVGVFISRRFAPSKTRTDLQDYYNLTAWESAGRAAADSNELSIVIDNEILDQEEEEAFRAVQYDDGVYVPVSLIQDRIDTRFYLDDHENLVIYTDAAGSVISNVGSSSYTYDGVEKNAGYAISREIGGEVYLNMDFVTEHSTAVYQVFSTPARIYIQNQ